jgi:DNA-binding NarL/FixJ family response regulator
VAAVPTALMHTRNRDITGVIALAHEARRLCLPVGAGHDCRPIVDALAAGRSIVLVGPLGSGKSHLLRDVTAHLVEASSPPVLLHPGIPASDASALLSALGTRPAEPDAGAERLPPVIVVDDAQDLDEGVAAALVLAVHHRRATALLGISIRRDGSPYRETGARSLAVDLWLRGLADRIDLDELTSADADALLARWGRDDFDTLTRSTVIGLADSSRMLLRELAETAAGAQRHGRDPLSAIRDVHVGSRLADAVATHVDQFAAAQRLAMAVLGRLPRITHTDALRLLSHTCLDTLVGSGTTWEDGTPERRITVNPLLAREAERTGEHEVIDALVLRAAERMLSPGAGWWSAALAHRIAASWHGGGAEAPSPAGIDATTRARVYLDAARISNDAGEYDLAAAYARHGLDAADGGRLRLELIFADVSRGLGSSPVGMPIPDSADLDRETLFRWLRVISVLPVDGNGSAQAEEFLAGVSGVDEIVDAELALMRAQWAAGSMRWADAVQQVREIMSRPGASSSTRMRAAALAGFALSCLGDLEDAWQWVRRGRRLAGARQTSSAAATIERLSVLLLQILSPGMAVDDAHRLLTDVEEECLHAALDGDPQTLALAGFVAAAAHTAVGDDMRAFTEIRATLRRAHPTVAAPWVGAVSIFVSRALAMAGHAAEAQWTLELMDPPSVGSGALVRHGHLIAQGCILATAGDVAEAIEHTREAARLAEDSPLLLADDLLQIVVLGDGDDVTLARLHHLAAAHTSEAITMLHARAESFASARASSGDTRPLIHLHDAATWGADALRRGGRTRIAELGAPAVRRNAGAAEASTELTRREREIALLVDEGLSNREIATRLYLSVRTVESHIYQARAKLTAGTRGELGRLVAGEGGKNARSRR